MRFPKPATFQGNRWMWRTADIDAWLLEVQRRKYRGCWDWSEPSADWPLTDAELAWHRRGGQMEPEPKRKPGQRGPRGAY
jgi:hypothetical protein